jgi:hypothetical protein
VGSLINRYVLGLLPKISLSAEKRDKVAEALTQYIEAQVTSELDRVRVENLATEQGSMTTESPPAGSIAAPQLTRPKKPSETMIGIQNTP